MKTSDRSAWVMLSVSFRALLVKEFHSLVDIDHDHAAVLYDSLLDVVVLQALGRLMADAKEFLNALDAVDEAAGGVCGSVCGTLASEVFVEHFE